MYVCTYMYNGVVITTIMIRRDKLTTRALKDVKMIKIIIVINTCITRNKTILVVYVHVYVYMCKYYIHVHKRTVSFYYSGCLYY